MEKSVRIIIIIALAAIMGILAYKIVAGIQSPIKFEEEKTSRFQTTVNQLIAIRTAQNAYKEVNGHYTPSFDTLINFVVNGKLKIVKAIGNVPDSLSEKEALKLGIISRDTSLISVKDSLFKNCSYPIERLGFTQVGRIVNYKMDTATVITGSGVAVKVFQCYALYDDLLDGLERQLIVNYKAKKNDSCLRVGKIDEANNNAGNWDESLENKKKE